MAMRGVMKGPARALLWSLMMALRVWKVERACGSERGSVGTTSLRFDRDGLRVGP
jgi:hypothetical protein